VSLSRIRHGRMSASNSRRSTNARDPRLWGVSRPSDRQLYINDAGARMIWAASATVRYRPGWSVRAGASAARRDASGASDSSGNDASAVASASGSILILSGAVNAHPSDHGAWQTRPARAVGITLEWSPYPDLPDKHRATVRVSQAVIASLTPGEIQDVVCLASRTPCGARPFGRRRPTKVCNLTAVIEFDDWGPGPRNPSSRW